ncbi:serine/threonine-protein kinase WNK (With NoLysine)-related [Striga asiatica]|uniref:Serine/threonine-protein kinase WNK (With NoLysine)-related n=1 Tax=Striga asiatica TaxID=4170 RepID=A0A5A7Q1J0_STRAF|nr:serine/threonine-protein kinase WNK (With NoLysine)-related [Striga asiatica]
MSLSPAKAMESISSCSAYIPIYKKTLSVRSPEMDSLFKPLHDCTIAPKPSSRGRFVTASGMVGFRVHSRKRMKLGQFLATVMRAAFSIEFSLGHPHDMETSPSSVTPAKPTPYKSDGKTLSSSSSLHVEPTTPSPLSSMNLLKSIKRHRWIHPEAPKVGTSRYQSLKSRYIDITSKACKI